MKSKSRAKKARPSTPPTSTTDLGVLAAQAQAAVKRAQADKLKSKQAKRNFKVAKAKLKQARQRAKASARLAKKARKALEKLVARQRKAAKKAVKAVRKKGKQTKPAPAAKPGASRSGRMAVRKRPTAPVAAASQPVPVITPAAPASTVAADPASSTGAASSPGPVL